jgi:NAD(P)-dependent dehydrogenase (short-subunit alcohol dehydrogenase family)
LKVPFLEVPMPTNSNTRMSTGELAGQVAIVTGGGRGLGCSMAQALASAGASVAVVARSGDQLAETVALIEKTGGRAMGFRVDVTDFPAVQQMADQVEQDLGEVDLLVNNAAILGPPAGPIWEVDPEQWWRCLAINLRGPFLCARAVLPGMIVRRRGRIINVSSDAGLRPNPYGSAYGISKTALVRFSESLAAETEEHGIRVFAIDPGTVRTAMTESLLQSPAAQKWMPWFREIFEKGQDVLPERAAQLVLFLALGRADALSGSFISVCDNVAHLLAQAAQIKQKNLYTLRLRR